MLGLGGSQEPLSLPGLLNNEGPSQLRASLLRGGCVADLIPRDHSPAPGKSRFPSSPLLGSSSGLTPGGQCPVVQRPRPHAGNSYLLTQEWAWVLLQGGCQASEFAKSFDRSSDHTGPTEESRKSGHWAPCPPLSDRGGQLWGRPRACHGKLCLQSAGWTHPRNPEAVISQAPHPDLQAPGHHR